MEILGVIICLSTAIAYFAIHCRNNIPYDDFPGIHRFGHAWNATLASIIFVALLGTAVWLTNARRKELEASEYMDIDDTSI